MDLRNAVLGASDSQVPSGARIPSFIADFRGLKFTHNGVHVLDGVPGTHKLQCEVFSPLPLGIAESHCIRLPSSFARPLEAIMQ